MDRLSDAMLGQLVFLDLIRRNKHLWEHLRRPGRPARHPELSTHMALLRRGLIREADDEARTATLTKTGLDVLSQQVDGWTPWSRMDRLKE